ncbi:MAG: T9SS type A sorting domain-containing protein [Prevotellaceae bacterium]|jgi:hypothetical protein|nr:T9SS type A sorting domain-containing protein [Prevotellaceae bacterium]
MKKHTKESLTFFFAFWLSGFISLTATAQTAAVDWRGIISIGGNHAKVYCNINLKETAELYLQMNALQVTGNLTGKIGSKVYISADDVMRGFVDISGAATGETEIIPEIFPAWDGSRINFVNAKQNGSAFGAFQMQDIETGDFVVQLKYEEDGDNLVWYIEKNKINPCLPLIVQLGNHTLLVNNNSATNGGYKFVYYYWYKNGELLKEGSHADNGGSYYTGGADLDENAEYTAKTIDSEGKHHLSCSYRYVRTILPINVIVYPNPVPRNTKAYIRAETQDLSLLQNASVEIYDIMGRYVGKANISGQTLTSVDLPAKAGIYILIFRAKDYVKNIKVLVE